MNRTALPTRTAQSEQTFTLGQAVVFYIDNPANRYQYLLDGRPTAAVVAATGTVVGLGWPGDRMIDVRWDNAPADISTVRTIDRRRVAPASTCETCAGGCDCDGGAEHPGCGHWACWGPATYTTTLDDCPGVVAERAQSEAYKFARGWTA